MLFCLISTDLILSSAAEDRAACTADTNDDRLLRKALGQEEELHGLEMLQVKASETGSELAADKNQQEAGEQNKEDSALDLSQADTAAVDAEDESGTLDLDVKSDPDWDLLEERDAERVRFIAYHPEWHDVLDVWQDGFFQRYYTGDAGMWFLKDDKLYLKWIGWPEEELASKDGGRSFVSSKNQEFVIKNPFPSAWWLSHFGVNFRTDAERRQALNLQQKTVSLAQINKPEVKKTATDDGSSDAEGGGEVVDGSEEADPVIKKIIATHGIGKRADLDEHGYRMVAALKDNDQMALFMRRAVAKLGFKISDEENFGFAVPNYSGVRDVKTYTELARDLDEQARDPLAEPHYLWDPADPSTYRDPNKPPPEM